MTLPATFVGRTDADDNTDKVAAVAHLTLEERIAVLEALCLLAAEQIAQRADGQRVLDWVDPLDELALGLIRRLQREMRAGNRNR